jgi:hypothetical protein
MTTTMTDQECQAVAVFRRTQLQARRGAAASAEATSAIDMLDADMMVELRARRRALQQAALELQLGRAYA